MAQTKPKAGQFYGVSDNGTDGQFLKTDGTGGMSWDSPIANPTLTSIDYPGTTTAANPTGGESVIINGTGFVSGITCLVGGTSAVTTFNSATQITITTPAKAAGQYAVAVTNSNGGTVSVANFIQYSGVPIWSTASGNIGSIQSGLTASFQVTATEGSDTIEYAVTTGALPTGLSLATATGTITGTAPTVSSPTTTTFSITATDDENQTSSARSFNITVNPDVPSNHFAPYIYTGNGGTKNIPLNFSPGLTWIKSRTNPYDHNLYDIVRGADGQSGSSDKVLMTNKINAAEQGNGDVTITNSGVTVVETGVGSSGNEVNLNGANYISWNFKAGGAAVTNNVGDISSEVSANTTSGFSITKYTGNGSANQSVGNGLTGGVDLIFIKNIDASADWAVFSSQLGSNQFLELARNYAASTNSALTYAINSTTVQFTSSSPHTMINGSGSNYIMYSWKSVANFTKVGTYTGTGATGKTIQTDFKPAFVMIKRTNGTGDFNMWDNKRGDTSILWANGSNAEATNNAYQIDFLSNGFVLQITSDFANGNGSNYIYLAIAADGSTTTPSLANSFDTITYTGSSGTQSTNSLQSQSGSVGFKPDMIWFKSRSNATWNVIHDSVRGAISRLFTNSTAAASAIADGFVSFDSNGFTVDGTGSGGDVNSSGRTYVAWNWKAGGLPAINSDGDITSIVSANQNAGFSIVKYPAASSGTFTVGHGLSAATLPQLVITKITDLASYSWYTWVEGFNQSEYLTLNGSSAKLTYSNMWAATPVTSTTFSHAVGGSTIANSQNIAYCFTSIPGYSKVGTYTGLGSGGPLTVNVGFAPTLGLIKRTDSTGGWRMFDTVRGTDKSLRANSDGAEYDDTNNYMDFTTTGFYFSNSQTNPDINAAGGTYIYLAIKEN